MYIYTVSLTATLLTVRNYTVPENGSSSLCYCNSFGSCKDHSTLLVLHRTLAPFMVQMNIISSVTNIFFILQVKHFFHFLNFTYYQIRALLLMHSDAEECSVSVLSDLRAAFDTFDHSLLINKLKWDSSLGQRWSSSVAVGNNAFSFETLSCGVPQGFDLGPGSVLYTLYSGQIINHFKKVSPIIIQMLFYFTSCLCLRI